MAYLRRWLSCSLWTKRLKTTVKNRSTLAPMPGFLLSRFPAMLRRVICRFLFSQAKMSDTSTTSLEVTGITGH